jgi:uncharacterized protein YggE
MKLQSLWGLLLVAIAANLQAQETTPRVPEVVTTATGQVRVVPSRAVLTVTVETTASSATSAAAENARRVAATLQSLRQAGVNDAAMTNGAYSVTQEFENGDRRKFRGFVARNSIRVETAAAFDVGKLIDAALAGGATLVSPIQFLGEDMPGARREALKKAVDEARRDAAALAEAAGGSLGRLLSVTSSANIPAYGAVLASAVVTSGYAPATQITPNELMIGATATTRWEFIQHK